MIESHLQDLASLGWTISWAFQFSPSEWRMSIIREEDVGCDQGSYISHCASAPTFAEALEDCMSKMAEAEFEPANILTFTKEPSPKIDLVSALGLRSAPIRRRV